MSTATFVSNLPTISPTPSRKEHGPDPIPVEKAFLKQVHRPLTLLEKLSHKIGCPSHTFSMPQTRQDVPLQVAYPWTVKEKSREQEFDSHQVCTQCGLTRFFNSARWISGPEFKWTDSGSPELRQQRPFDVFVKDEAVYLSIPE